MRSASRANASGRTFSATSRPSFASRARYTSPIPPAPMAPVISYGPSLLPALSTRSLLSLVISAGRSDAAKAPQLRPCRPRREARRLPRRPGEFPRRASFHIRESVRQVYPNPQASNSTDRKHISLTGMLSGNSELFQARSRLRGDRGQSPPSPFLDRTTNRELAARPQEDRVGRRFRAGQDMHGMSRA